MRQEIRLAGFGGQGVISMGILLAIAAGKYEGREVAQTQSYGPEARGGACKTEVVISDAQIDYIKALKPDYFVAMSQPALDKYLHDVDAGQSMVIVDSTLVGTVPEHLANVRRIPATQFAEDFLGARVAANVFMLGALTRLSRLVSADSCRKAIGQTMAPKLVDINLSAFEAGMRYVDTH